MTTTHQQARLLQAADRDARHVWPDLHSEAMHYCREFGRARGMLEAILETIEDDVLPEETRAKVMTWQLARVRKAISEWKA